MKDGDVSSDESDDSVCKMITIVKMATSVTMNQSDDSV